ncbi:hypothetical protein ASG40_04535 [Methylobacterium sp. Leaf399]|uniref:cytochrome D1 domain-containing protein n=1 Tax=Methylobacterium sp. Leaf399 TaxID=1736364 RepID=UPI0006F2C4ED|nr:YncE family protein [Methylobacterium sp. Leaf399]KQT14597.1 hypothetical protein ASG40_04535 [Methylobacterium sp. Leaf399]
MRRFGLACLCLALSCGRGIAGTVYVASQEAGAVARIEAGTTGALAAIAVGGGPAQVAAGPDGRLYLTQPDGHAVTVVDPATNTVLRRLPFAGQAFGIAVSADGAGLFVGDWANARVVRLSAETGAVEGSVAVGREPAGLVLDARGRLYVADRESRQVSVVDTATMTRTDTLPVGEAPFALALSPKQDRLYVANVRSGDLSVLETGSARVLATVRIGGMPYGVAASADGRLVLVTDQQAGRVVALDAATLGLQATVSVGRYPEGIVVDRERAYVANWFSDSVSVIDLATLAETGRIPVGAGPRSLAVVPDPPARRPGGGRP